MRTPLPGAVPSPNIWHHTETYELENRAVDPDGLVEAAIRDLADWAGRDVLDLGCGTGFHLPRWAADARRGVRRRAAPGPRGGRAPVVRRGWRTSRSCPARRSGSRSPDASVDVMQARWAYFFGPGCEPGLRELDRVMRRGGTAFVVDNDPRASTFGGVVPARLPERRRRRGGAVLVRARLAAHGRSTSGGGSTAGRTSRPRAHRARRAGRRRRRSPSTRASRWTTPSTSGGSASGARATLPLDAGRRASG